MVFVQDIFILDQSAFFGGGDLHDRHRDMRLDVDNMSYEVIDNPFPVSYCLFN